MNALERRPDALNVKPTKGTLKRQRWALALAAKGFLILELRPGSKRPKGGLAWGLHATSDPDKIRAMFRENPAMNYGVCPSSDYVIIDLDVKIGANGIEVFELLEIEHGVIPETFQVRTRGGGLHVYLKVPEEAGNANKFPDGIDVRGGGGYVVGPGCEVSDGTYTHESGDLDSIADCPKWVRGFLGRPACRDPKVMEPFCDLDLEHNIELAERFLANREPAIDGENGNDLTFTTVAFLRDFGLSQDMALAMILESDWNLKRCEPAWAADEMEEMVDHVYRYPQNRPGCKRSPLSQVRQIADVIPLHPEQYQKWRKERTAIAGTGSAVAPDVRDDDIPTRPVAGTGSADAEDIFVAYMESELGSIADPDFLIDRVTGEDAIHMVYGPSGSLKTFLELDKALHGVTGRTWAAKPEFHFDGHVVKRPLRVAMIVGEGARGIKRRIRAWKARHGVTDDLAMLIVPKMPVFKFPSEVEKLARTIKHHLGTVDLVIVDTAMRASSGLNLSDPAGARDFLDTLDTLRELLDGCSLSLVHHSGKDLTRGALGAEYLKGHVDFVDFVELIHKSPGKRIIKITNQKTKDDEERPDMWMQATLEDIPDDGADGIAVASLVLERCSEPKGLKAGTSAGMDPRLTAALKIIAENKGKGILSGAVLCEAVVNECAEVELTDGEQKVQAEHVRAFFRTKDAEAVLAPYRHRYGNERSVWVYEDRAKKDGK